MAGSAPRKKLSEMFRHGVEGVPVGRFAVVAARFNEAISKKLADGAASALEAGGVTGERVEIHWVPGSFELPQAAMALARTGRYAGIVCVGVIIRGETPHFEYLSGAVAHGLSRVALETRVPVSFGVITSLTEAQAWERAGGAVGHRGEEAARATLEMAAWMRGLKAGRAAKRRR
jgi:6,7-dimethyl-8-ribityllumazine synthase